MSTVKKPMYGWNAIRWREVERHVFKKNAEHAVSGSVKEMLRKWTT